MRRSIPVLAIVAALAAAGGAHADGLPVLGVDVGPVGVVAPASARYVTLPAGRDTVVARTDTGSGRVVSSRLLRGTFTIPAVAYDGSADGLSGDGRTLVLIEPRASFPRARTTLAVLDTRLLKARAVVRLRGDFSFDAVSPRGSLLYLIQYTDPRDPTRYLVRAYDVPAARLLTRPVVDPNEADEDMRGRPLTRAASPGGRWAYTLYDGNGGTPFVHALDTRTATARCIDLDALAGRPPARPRLELRGGRLAVLDGHRTLALVDTRTFAVARPDPPRAAGSGRGWTPAAAAAVLVALAAAALVLGRRLRRQSVQALAEKPVATRPRSTT